MLFAPLAFTLTFLQICIYQSPPLYFYQLYGMCFALTAAFTITLFYSGGFGGADAKALMCLALALPFYPESLLTPVSRQISPISQNFFSITVFSNSVLLAAATAVYMLLHNILRHKTTDRKLFPEDYGNQSWGRKGLVLITGYKVAVDQLKEKWHLYPLEDVENTENGIKRKLILLPKDEGREAIIKRLAEAVEAGQIGNRVWATPGLPMLIFITAGLIVSLLLGDIVWILVNFLLP